MTASTTRARGATGTPTLQPPPRHPHFPLADGIRGLAAAAIVVVHVHFFTGGAGQDGLLDRAAVRLDVVLPLFFALSAFLLYRPLIAHRTGGPGAPALSRFARGRVLRIFPLYWVVLTLLAIFPGLAGVFSGDWLQFYSLFSSVDPGYNDPDCAGQLFRCGLPQTWSLVAELSFYALLPLYALVMNRLARGRPTRTWVRTELLILFAIAAILVLGSTLGLRDDPVWRYTVLGTGLWFAVGLMLAIGSVSGMAARAWAPVRLLARRPALSWGAAFVIYGVLVLTLEAVPFVVAIETAPEFLVSHISFALICLFVMIPVLLGNPNLGWPRRLMAHPFVLWLGALSYGIYLWHVTIAFDLGVGGGDGGFWIVLLMTYAITIPLAAITYYVVELPAYSFVKRPLMQRLRSLRRGGGAG